jgi:hypothetical protein
MKLSVLRYSRTLAKYSNFLPNEKSTNKTGLGEPVAI